MLRTYLGLRRTAWAPVTRIENIIHVQKNKLHLKICINKQQIIKSINPYSFDSNIYHFKEDYHIQNSKVAFFDELLLGGF